MGKRWMDIERFLSWVLVEQRADKNLGVGLFEGERAAAGYVVGGNDSVTRVQNAAILGCQVSGGGGSSACHEDAETAVYLMMQILRGEDLALVVKYALRGSRPDWGAEGVRYEPVYRFSPARGRMVPKLHYDKNRRARFCYVSDVASRERVESERKTYATWHQALHRLYILYAAETGHFTEHAVTAFKVPAVPWHNQVAKGG